MSGDRKPTIHDVAKLAGASVGTVSRVLNEHPSVSKGVRRRVFEAVAQLGYSPNAVAQSMRTRATYAIGLMVTDFSNPLFSVIAKAAEETLREERYSLVLANSNDQPAREAELLNFFLQRRVDALMLTISDETNVDLHAALEKVTVPFIFLDREPPVPSDAVMTDHANGLRQATEYLLDLGHRRIGLITASAAISPGRARVAGFCEAFARRGFSVPVDLIRQHSFASEFGFEETYSLMQSREPPTALIAGGNQILTGVLRALRALNLATPSDISLISCDDSPLTLLHDPPITVVSRDLAEIGRTAARLLLVRLSSEGARDPVRVVTPTHLVLRDSCRSPRASRTNEG